MDNKIETDVLESVTPPKENGFKKILNKTIDFIKKAANTKYSYLFLCFFIPLCLMRLIYIAVGVFPGLDGSVLVLDLNGQYVYFYEALREFIHGDASWFCDGGEKDERSQQSLDEYVH